MKNGEHSSSPARLLDQVTAFRRRGRQRLVDDDVQTRCERRQSERYVSSIGRRHNNQIDIARMIPELRCSLEETGARVRVTRFLLPRWIAGYNRCEGQSGGHLDQRTMKGRTGESVTDETNAK